jgi:hypothetical protein
VGTAAYVAGALCVAALVVVGAREWLAVGPFVIGFAIALVVPTWRCRATAIQETPERSSGSS